MNRLRDLREENDLTQSSIAKVLNMSQNGYSDYETEKVNIPISVLRKLSDFYNTSIDYLLYETDKRERYPKSIMKEKKNV